MTVDEALAWAHRGIVISTEQALREAFDEAHEAGGVLAAEVEWLRGQLSAAHDVRDVFARDLNRMVAESEKDQLDRDAVVASLTDELRRAKAKAEQYQIDWMEAKAEFGDKMAVLRQQCEMEERARQKAEQMAITALAEKQQAEAAMEATLRACPNCEGTGVMSVLVAVHPPDEREEYADTQCAECGGNGLSIYGQLERDLAEARVKLAEAMDGGNNICGYCGLTLQKPNAWDDLRQHIEVCDKHPLATARAEAEGLRVLLQARDAETDALRAEVIGRSGRASCSSWTARLPAPT